jgi:hypothetical protein
MDILMWARKLDSSHRNIIVTCILMIEIGCSVDSVVNNQAAAGIHHLRLSQHSCGVLCTRMVNSRSHPCNLEIASLACKALWAEACLGHAHGSIETVGSAGADYCTLEKSALPGALRHPTYLGLDRSVVEMSFHTKYKLLEYLSVHQFLLGILFSRYLGLTLLGAHLLVPILAKLFHVRYMLLLSFGPSRHHECLSPDLCLTFDCLLDLHQFPFSSLKASSNIIKCLFCRV